MVIKNKTNNRVLFTLNSRHFKDYTVDMYVRQFWVDKRLSFNKFDGVEELVIGSDMLHKIWTPDTFLGFININLFYYLLLFQFENLKFSSK